MSRTCRNTVSAAAVAAALSLSVAGPACATFTLEGDAMTLTVVAESVSRRELVDAIVQKFGMAATGGTIEESEVSGRFHGTLGHILKSILPRNGFAIAYSDGRPVRVTFTGQPAAGMAASPLGLDPLQGLAGAGTAGMDPTMPVLPGTAEQQARQRMIAPAGPDPAGILPPDAVQAVGAGSGQGDGMQGDIAEATARALIQLKALTGDLQKTGN